jgi:hypothetical protein
MRCQRALQCLARRSSEMDKAEVKDPATATHSQRHSTWTVRENEMKRHALQCLAREQRRKGRG